MAPGPAAYRGPMTNPAERPVVEPDTKDWTWVLERVCPECGFDAGQVAGTDVAFHVAETAHAWIAVLARPDARERPAPGVWSPLEYACHVRDVHGVFADRVARMIAEDEPTFDNWDQDAAAIEGRYGEQDPQTVLVELIAAADHAAAVFSSVPPDAWDRIGNRSNGSVFTVETIGRYYAHDLRHHIHDVAG